MYHHMRLGFACAKRHMYHHHTRLCAHLCGWHALGLHNASHMLVLIDHLQTQLTVKIVNNVISAACCLAYELRSAASPNLHINGTCRDSDNVIIHHRFPIPGCYRDACLLPMCYKSIVHGHVHHCSCPWACAVYLPYLQLGWSL